jgi:hypothetical protein
MVPCIPMILANMQKTSIAWAEGVHATPHQHLRLLLGLLHSLWIYIISLFSASPPLLSRRPDQALHVPCLRVIDARSTRAKLLILSQEDQDDELVEYQLRYRLDDEGQKCLQEEDIVEDEWIVETFKPGRPRNLVCLHEHSAYKARVRSRRDETCSEWGPLIKWHTLLLPVNGGADMGTYTWGQNASEVWVTVYIPVDVRSRHVSVVLKSDYLLVSHTVDGSTVTTIEGQLPWRVRLLSPEGGSHWEISRDAGICTLCVVLEKQISASNLRWGLWRSMFVGHDEIDTHAMELDPHIDKIMQSLHKAPGTELGSGMELTTKAQSTSGHIASGTHGQSIPDNITFQE